jgi:hypothetical protein
MPLSSSLLSRSAPSLDRINELTRPGIHIRALDNVLNILGTAGIILDTPGSAIRGLLSSEPERALTGIFNPSRRVSGTELLGGPKDRFTWSGLGAEMLLDPINFLSYGGLSTAGKLAKRADKLAAAVKGTKGFEKFTPMAAIRRQSVIDDLAKVRKLQQQPGGGAKLLYDEFGSRLHAYPKYGDTLAQQAQRGQRTGLAFDVPLTPINIPLTSGKWGLPVLSKLASAGRAVPGVSQTSRVTRSLFDRNFNPKTGKPFTLEQQAFRTEAQNVLREADARGVEFQKKIDTKISRLVKETGLDRGVIDKQIADAVEFNRFKDQRKVPLKRPTKDNPNRIEHRPINIFDPEYGTLIELEKRVANNHPSVQKIADQLTRFNDYFYTQGRRAGVPVDELKGGFGYFPRRLTPKAQRHLAKLQKKGDKDSLKAIYALMGGSPGFIKRRGYKDLSLTELNKHIKNELGVDFDWYSTDVATVMGFRARDQYRAMANSRGLEAAIRSFGKAKPPKDGPVSFADLEKPLTGGPIPEKDLANLFVRNKKPVTTTILEPDRTLVWSNNATRKQIKKALDENGITERFVDSETYDNLGRILSIPKDPEGGKDFLKFIDSINGVYRGALTVLFPAFHARNFSSGGFMNWLAGVRDPRLYKEAVERLARATPAEKIKFHSIGITGKGINEETLRLIESSEEGRRLLSTKPLQYSFNKGRLVGQMGDDVNRMVLYLDGLKKGLGDTEAARRVIKYHFDYNDLTTAERLVLRRSVLFYTFIRNNVPLMLEAIVKNPRTIQAYNRATGKTNVNIIEPDWLNDSFFLGEDEKGKIRRVGLGLPIEDLSRFDTEGKGIVRFAQLMFTQLNPAFTAPFEILSGKDLYFDSPVRGGQFRRLLEISPAARLAGTLERGAKDPKAEALRTITSLNIKHFDPEQTKRNLGIERIKKALQREATRGRAKEIPIFSGDSAKVQELNQTLNRLFAQSRK